MQIQARNVVSQRCYPIVAGLGGDNRGLKTISDFHHTTGT
jgi:hypothetical protein